MAYDDKTPMGYPIDQAADTYDEGLRSYLLGVYNYMASALALTGAAAYMASTYQPLYAALYAAGPGGHMGLTGLGMLVTFAPLLFVLVLSFGINKLSLPAVQGIFWGYAAVMGLSLSSLALVYTGESIARVFLITTILFGSISMFGYATKRDLTGMGHFMMMGLWGMIIASIVNVFMHSSGMSFMLSILGVVIFTGLTAYDTQRIKQMYYYTSGDSVMAGKSSIMGALTLYLDFINLFISLLRIMGDRR